VDKATGLCCNQTIMLSGIKAAKDYPVPLRRVKFYDAEHDKLLVFLTNNNFDLPALTIAQLYRCRWQVELFFKWIKQHLRIKAFFGPSENAVKTQVWIALSTYILVAIVKKRLHAKTSLYTILQILSLTLFEKTSLLQLVDEPETMTFLMENDKQLNLFD
jgi:IS4 transposase